MPRTTSNHEQVLKALAAKYTRAQKLYNEGYAPKSFVNNANFAYRDYLIRYLSR